MPDLGDGMSRLPRFLEPRNLLNKGCHSTMHAPMLH